MVLRSTASPRVGTLVLVLLSTLVGKVGALNLCRNEAMGCSTQCDENYSLSGKYFYKTTQAMASCKCNGNEFPVYQWGDATTMYNEYMYYSCAAGKWGTGVISNVDTATGGGFPNVHDRPATSTSQCPDGGGATCTTTTTAPTTTTPTTTTPTTSGTTGSDATTPTAGACSDDDAICAPMAALLPSMCSCSGTNGGTGSFTECQEDLGIIGSVGIRVEMEPCDCGGAYAKVSYKAGSDWTTAGRLAAGESNSFGIPGFSYNIPLVGEAGLYADVAISGDKSSLVFDVHLSMCLDGACNGNLPGWGVGATVSAMGFPFAVVKGAGVDFTEQCKCADECTSDSSIGVIIGIAIAVFVLLIAGTAAGVVIYKKKQAAAAAAAGGKAQGGVALTIPSAAPLPVATPVVPMATPVETKV